MFTFIFNNYIIILGDVMRKSNGWGLGMMVVMLSVIFIFFIIAIYYLYRLYSIGVIG